MGGCENGDAKRRPSYGEEETRDRGNLIAEPNEPALGQDRHRYSDDSPEEKARWYLAPSPGHAPDEDRGRSQPGNGGKEATVTRCQLHIVSRKHLRPCLPNGSRLSCGRGARGRKEAEPLNEPACEGTQFFPSERPTASSAC
jgi:hypothetical protein